jgi:probable phosphoglycerate mutase
MPPASPHGEHFAEVVLVRHGQTDWNVSRIIQVFSLLLDHLLNRFSLDLQYNTVC